MTIVLLGFEEPVNLPQVEESGLKPDLCSCVTTIMVMIAPATHQSVA
jgi:hypothetical protein